jgi:hypothetical protein
MQLTGIRAIILTIALALTLAAPAYVQAETAKKAPTATEKRTQVPENRQFKTEAAAKAACGTDTVVWLNTSSRVYHFSWAKTYGNTKRGFYGCEKEVLAAGNRASKEKQRPAKTK